MGAEGLERNVEGQRLALKTEREGRRKGGRAFLKTVDKGRDKEGSALAQGLGSAKGTACTLGRRGKAWRHKCQHHHTEDCLRCELTQNKLEKELAEEVSPKFW